MKLFILMNLIFTTHVFSKSVKVEDPNSYFKDKQWSIEVDKTTSIIANSKYNGEPIQKPSLLNAKINCPNKKDLVVLKDIKFCGIDSIKMIGGKLEILFADYNFKDPKGYCNKKRTQYFEVPKCKSL